MCLAVRFKSPPPPPLPWKRNRLGRRNIVDAGSLLGLNLFDPTLQRQYACSSKSIEDAEDLNGWTSDELDETLQY